MDTFKADKALCVIAGPFFKFTAVKLKGPNKHLRP